MSATQLSVIVQVEPDALSLKRLMESLTAPQRGDWEVMLVADEQTRDICSPYLHLDSVRMIFISESVTLKERKRIIDQQSLGYFISYITSWDYFYPWALPFIVAELKKYPEAGGALLSVSQNDEKPYPALFHSSECLSLHFSGKLSWPDTPSLLILRKSHFLGITDFYSWNNSLDFKAWFYDFVRRCAIVLFPDSLIWIDNRKFIGLSFRQDSLFKSELQRLREFNKSKVIKEFQGLESIKRYLGGHYFKNSLRNFFHFRLNKAFFYFRCWLSLAFN